MPKKKIYAEKLRNSKNLPKIVELDEKGRKRWGGKTMVVPAPMEVYEIIKSVPEGKLVTINEIRELLARKHGTNTTCPLTTGIFVNICANASLEMEDDLPYWRTLKSRGEINPKYPNAPQEQIAMLEAEGFEIIEKGRKNIKYFVKNYEEYLPA